MRFLRTSALRAAWVASLVMGGLVLGWGIGPAGAAPTVVNCSKGGDLQTAINGASPGSTIFVHGTCDGDFTIDENLTLDGPAILDGENSVSSPGRVLTITAGTVFLNALTIENGWVYDGGGGIDNAGTLTLIHSVVTDNLTHNGGGGGILNTGTVTLTSSTVSNNNANTSPGGGIYNDDGTVTLFDSDVLSNGTNNNPTPQGAGIWNNDGTLKLYSSTVSGNYAIFGGGGITNLGGVVTLTGSTVVNNTVASGDGGGIDNIDGGTLTVDGSSVLHNTAGTDGGGISNESGALTIDDSNVSANTAFDGGGIFTGGETTGGPILGLGSIAVRYRQFDRRRRHDGAGLVRGGRQHCHGRRRRHLRQGRIHLRLRRFGVGQYCRRPRRGNLRGRWS